MSRDESSYHVAISRFGDELRRQSDASTLLHHHGVSGLLVMRDSSFSVIPRDLFILLQNGRLDYYVCACLE